MVFTSEEDAKPKQPHPNGLLCKGCGADKASEWRGPGREFCSKCNLACYCSVDCQKRHWKWRHKRECRPKDSFALGDYACLGKFLSIRRPSYHSHGQLD